MSTHRTNSPVGYKAFANKKYKKHQSTWPYTYFTKRTYIFKDKFSKSNKIYPIARQAQEVNRIKGISEVELHLSVMISYEGKSKP